MPKMRGLEFPRGIEHLGLTYRAKITIRKPRCGCARSPDALFSDCIKCVIHSDPDDEGILGNMHPKSNGENSLFHPMKCPTLRDEGRIRAQYSPAISGAGNRNASRAFSRMGEDFQCVSGEPDNHESRHRALLTSLHRQMAAGAAGFRLWLGGGRSTPALFR